jgi:hypothetical protein
MTPQPTAPGTQPAGQGTAVATQNGGTAPATGDPAEAGKRFEAWQKALGAVGFTVTSGHVALADNALALTDFKLSGAGWNWTASQARVSVAGDDNFDITASGEQRVSFTLNDKAVAYRGTAQQVKVGLHKGGGPGRILSLQLVALTLAGENDTSPISVGSGALRLVTNDDEILIPVATDGELELTDLVLPSQAGNPLGTTIDNLSARLFFQKEVTNGDPNKALQPWIGQTDALTLASIALTWGTLKLSGVGAVGLDDAGRPAGHLDVRIPDIMGMLDAINVLYPFAPEVLANMYSTLLLDDGSKGNDFGLPFTVRIADGAVMLSERPQNIDDIALGTVGQLYAPAAGQ